MCRETWHLTLSNVQATVGAPLLPGRRGLPQSYHPAKTRQSLKQHIGTDAQDTLLIMPDRKAKVQFQAEIAGTLLQFDSLQRPLPRALAPLTWEKKCHV